MSNYIIHLKPLTPFFFGGEYTFGEGNVNYYVRSGYLPQQTTLLGFLRYELLAQNGLLGTDPVSKNWAGLIGADSFQNSKVDGADNFTVGFGAIKQISPVFLSNGKSHYIPQALDWAMCEDKKVMPIHVSLINSEVETLTDSFRAKIPVLNVPVLSDNNKAYDPKHKLKELWVSADGNNLRQYDWEGKDDFKETQGFDNGFFIARNQVGIQRETKRSTKDMGNFYRQTLYELKDNFGFEFYATLDLPSDIQFVSRIVTMGGERSVFAMTVAPESDTFADKFNATTFSKGHNRDIRAIVLTSNAYIPQDVLTWCDFSITDSVPFRNIITKQSANGDYAKLTKEPEASNALKKSSELLYLAKRGSIFYGSDNQLTRLADKLNNPAFNNIGYNTFIKL